MIIWMMFWWFFECFLHHFARFFMIFDWFFMIFERLLTGKSWFLSDFGPVFEKSKHFFGYFLKIVWLIFHDFWMIFIDFWMIVPDLLGDFLWFLSDFWPGVEKSKQFVWRLVDDFVDRKLMIFEWFWTGGREV